MQFNPHQWDILKSKFMRPKCALLSLAALAIAVVSHVALRPASAALLFDPNQPSVGPGIQQVGSNGPKSAISNSKAGSLLFYPRYTSDAANPINVNTLISLTNTHPRDGITVRVFYVHNCQVDSTFVNLSGNQTRTLLAGSENPGNTGYIVATAVNPQGVPVQFNWLIGNASIRDANGHEAAYNAIGVAKRNSGPAFFNANNAVINFNDVEYDRLPQSVALDNIQSQSGAPGSAVRTDVALFSPLATLSNGSSQILKFTAIAYDQAGRPYPQVVDTTCGLNNSVKNIWTSPDIDTFIQPNLPGWGNFAATIDAAPVPVLGVSLTDAPNAPRHNARQMQVLSWLESFTMNIPVVAPPSGATDVFTYDQPDPAGGSLGASEMKVGSLLAYSRFTSGIYGSSHINVTNTHPTQRVRVRIFFTGLADTPAVKETIVSLAANQTATIDSNQIAPNQKGWALAMAIDNRALPLNFNYLIGSSQVREQNGQSFGYNASAFAKNSPGSIPRNSDDVTADIKFNDEDYDRLPATIALAGLPSQLDNITTLGYARPPLSLTDTPNIRGSVQATVIDDLLAQALAVIGSTEVNVGTLRPSSQAPPITSTIIKGHRGWMKLTPGTPIFAWTSNIATSPFNVQSPGQNWIGGLAGGTGLHVLAATENFVLKVSATNPNNLPPVADFERIDAKVEARSQSGTIVRLDARPSTDPNPDDPLTYQWFDDDKVISTAAVSDYRLSIGTHFLKLIVTDGSGIESEPAITSVEVRDTTGPLMSGIPSNITKVVDNQSGASLSFPIPVAYDFVDGPVTVMSSRAPGSFFRIGRTIVTFSAKDAAGNESKATLSVIVNSGTSNPPPTGGVPGNRLPYLNNLNDQYVVVGKTRTITLIANDEDNDPVIFSLLNGPSYARLDNVDPIARRATLVITPTQNSPTTVFSARIVATDIFGGSFSTLAFRIQVSDVENDDTGSGSGGGGGGGGGGTNRPPIAKAAPLPANVQATSKQGAVLQLDGSQSSDPDGDALSYVWKAGSQIIAEGAIATAMLPVGTYSITLTVSDGKGGTSTSSPQTVQVNPRPLSVISASPPRILKSNVVDKTTTITISGTGFTQSTQVRFDCTLFCQGGSQVAVTINSIEEDKIVLTVKTTPSTPTGNRDLVVTNPNGEVVKFSRSNIVAQ